jgi:hypothetical protein
MDLSVNAVSCVNIMCFISHCKASKDIFKQALLINVIVLNMQMYVRKENRTDDTKNPFTENQSVYSINRRNTRTYTCYLILMGKPEVKKKNTNKNQM